MTYLILLQGDDFLYSQLKRLFIYLIGLTLCADLFYSSTIDNSVFTELAVGNWPARCM